jgi:hypothetical protein
MGSNIFNPSTKSFNFYIKDGIWLLTRDLTVGTRIDLYDGTTFDLNDFNLVCNGIYANGVLTLKLGTGKTTITSLSADYYQY